MKHLNQNPKLKDEEHRNAVVEVVSVGNNDVCQLGLWDLPNIIAQNRIVR